MDIVEELFSSIVSKKRVCPQPDKWNELWKLLPNKKRIGNRWQPPLPLILAAWYDTSDSEKRNRFKIHLTYANENNAIDIVTKFLTSLNDNDWLYESEI